MSGPSVSDPAAAPSARQADRPIACLTARLNEREQEILRLLASGHTVKSIAAHLGRSEASIHERLRDARRKTGVGSSRELARLLDAEAAGQGQKNRDRKTDLPRAEAHGDGSAASGSSGRRRRKGPILMLLALPLGLAGLALLTTDAVHRAVPVVAPAALPGAVRLSPLVGRWSLDTAKIPAAERPRRVTIAFRAGPDRRWTTEVEVVAPDGTTLHSRSTAAVDGAPAPVEGTLAAIDTVSLRQPAPGTLVMTLGKAGAPVSTRVYTVARDRRTMTETIVWAGGSLPGLETTTFRRID